MQHSTGLYNKISRLNDPEEIKKWKEERKMKYPTKENIARKAAEIAEKLQRGERMGLQKNKSKQPNGNKNKSTSKNNYRSRKPKKMMENVTDIMHRKDSLHTSKRREFTKLTKVSEKQDNSHYSLKPFTGIQDLIMEDEDLNTEQHSELVLDIDDNEWTENMSHKTPKENISCNALSNLICNYGSDSEPEKIPNDNNDIRENSKPCPIFNQDSTVNLNINEKHKITLSDDSGPEEVKIDKKQIGLVDECIKEQKEIPRKQIRHNTKPLVKKYKKSNLPSTLLQKLLYKEMRHEQSDQLDEPNLDQFKSKRPGSQNLFSIETSPSG
ncbi:hypothetical protein EVAR_18866_1 [Eumeta japonica]|uniref:FMR1-interacting protein 1 conserved domain-containing protein n=1 Tax=Eumeta variegata TaxID=151549 RepID=A0A4C1UM43_EUMVA|nr:hypothetical protein EVAR_18866_1 [Eumeta japonica]